MRDQFCFVSTRILIEQLRSNSNFSNFENARRLLLAAAKDPKSLPQTIAKLSEILKADAP